MKKSRIDVIACPYCGAEYTAGEIFIPKYFLGYPKYLEREQISKKIIFDQGKMMDTKEHYICDYCNTPFIVKAFVKFNTEEDTRHNFNKPYKTKLKQNNLFLNED